MVFCRFFYEGRIRMNAAEQIVEVYYQQLKHSFTARDIKVIGGNNRQLDLLAYHPQDRECHHVETSISITHAFAQGHS